MTPQRAMSGAKLISLAAVTALLLGGCTYDYLQHSDRVAFSSGNAVKANLERETINPSRASMKSTAGLGKNGAVIPQAPPAL